MITVRDLSKSYRTVQALKGVSFDIGANEIVGLLGPNGAGKTTVIKTLTGYLQPGGGRVTVDGLDILSHRKEIQTRIGYLPENTPLYPELSVQDYLKMMADLRQVPPDQRDAAISEAVYATGLTDQLTRPIGQLSKGYRQRVGLAQAILAKPKLLILDEPTIGLDPTQVVAMRDLIRRLADHTTILFSTHILSEVEALCDRVIILISGEIRADAKLSDLATTHNAILVLQSEIPDLEREIRNLPHIREVEAIDQGGGYPTFRILGENGDDICPTIFELAQQRGWPLRELKRDTQTLETIFNRLATTA
ncbi:MAG: ATP-binding cassette domain-containing protein [Truepera sp.]|nr:ATP-binding cassette domain-containing protein [Truepera sp.]